MKKIVFGFILFLLFSLNVNASEDIVNIYLFHSNGCNHCKNEIELLNELEENYSNVRVYKYEINEVKNRILFREVTNLLDVKVNGVPFTVIGDKYFVGFNNNESKRIFMAAISYYSKYGYTDVVGEYIGDIEISSYDKLDRSIDIDSYIDSYGNYTVLGNIKTNDLDLSLTSMLLGIRNGFNIYNLLVLLLIIVLISRVKDKKRVLIYGFGLIISYCLLYFILFDMDILESLNLEFNTILSLNNLSLILEKLYILLYIFGIFIDFVIILFLFIMIKKRCYIS